MVLHQKDAPTRMLGAFLIYKTRGALAPSGWFLKRVLDLSNHAVSSAVYACLYPFIISEVPAYCALYRQRFTVFEGTYTIPSFA